MSFRSVFLPVTHVSLPVSPQVKFNQALADHSMSDKPRLIDGIVLTKFDTIDDKVIKHSLCSARFINKQRLQTITPRKV